MTKTDNIQIITQISASNIIKEGTVVYYINNYKIDEIEIKDNYTTIILPEEYIPGINYKLPIEYLRSNIYNKSNITTEINKI